MIIYNIVPELDLHALLISDLHIALYYYFESRMLIPHYTNMLIIIDCIHSVEKFVWFIQQLTFVAVYVPS